MSRELVVKLVMWSLAIALVVWIANNTYWTQIKIPMPPRGEAVTNPFYAIQRFSQALGARARWDRSLDLPPTDSVIFISSWNWELTSDRQRRIEHWVESGGRLVVDRSLITSTEAFERWSGIGREIKEIPKGTKALRSAALRSAADRCYTLDEQDLSHRESESHDTYSICGMEPWSSLTTTRKISWALRRDDVGIQAVRVKLGRGSVTMLNGTPFVARGLFDDDNAEFFVAATQLRHGDEIHFFSESSHASLIELAWQLGWPVICLSTALLAFGLWRSGARFGPLAAPTETARRSLAEQIRGTGAFTMRIGGGASLHAAAARALNEAASLHISAYDRLPGTERMSALAHATGFDADALASALHYSGSRRSEHLRAALELLESARRRILIKNTRSRHGNRN
jgi:hypothetical protein